MDMDTLTQDGDTGRENPESPSQQSNGDQNLDPSVNQVESQNNNTADDNPASQPNSQPASQSNGSPYTQPTAQPNGTQNSQASGHTETQCPPPGPGDATEEEPIDPQELLEPFAWDDLEERFALKMEECRKQEAEIEKEFREWCHVFQAWASTTREYEEERLHKRLKTRMAWVQNSESSLEEKRQHHAKVVQAFESALALLGGP